MQDNPCWRWVSQTPRLGERPQGDHRPTRVKRSDDTHGPQVCAARRAIRSGQRPGTELAGLKRRSRHDRVKFALARRDWRAYGAWCSLHSATTAHLTCRYALRVMVNIPRRSEWWRSATLTAGPCVSLVEIGKPTTACLVGHRAQPG